MRSTFKILMYLKKGSEQPNGNVLLMCRLTVDGEIKQFSCKMDVPPRLWDVKAAIKAVLKSGAVAPDYTHGGVVADNSILPDYYGLDMIIAIAFRIHSSQAQAFRELVLSRLNAVSKPTSAPLLIQVNSSLKNNELTNSGRNLPP